MSFWTPKNTNIFEEEIIIKIESRKSEIKRINAQIERTETMLQSSEIHEHLLYNSWVYLSKEAKVVSLSEAKVIKKSLISLWGDIIILKVRLDELYADVKRIESELAVLYVEKERVKFKLIEFKK